MRATTRERPSAEDRARRLKTTIAPTRKTKDAVPYDSQLHKERQVGVIDVVALADEGGKDVDVGQQAPAKQRMLANWLRVA